MTLPILVTACRYFKSNGKDGWLQSDWLHEWIKCMIWVEVCCDTLVSHLLMWNVVLSVKTKLKMFKSNPRKQPPQVFCTRSKKPRIVCLPLAAVSPLSEDEIDDTPCFSTILTCNQIFWFSWGSSALILVCAIPLQEILKMPRTSIPTSITVLLGIVTSLLCPTQHDLTGCQCRKHSNSAYAEKNKLVYVLYSTCAQCAR